MWLQQLHMDNKSWSKVTTKKKSDFTVVLSFNGFPDCLLRASCAQHIEGK